MKNVEALVPHYRSPNDLFEELGIDEPKQIQIEAIAQYCGATIIYAPLEGSGARLVGYGDRAIITVDNGNALHARQRFSAAHELGHWMHDRGELGFVCTASPIQVENQTSDVERRANRYAVDLLLPEAMFRRQAIALPFSFESIQALAAIFDTSVQATAIRFVELSSLPCLLICTEQGRRRWYVRSSTYPQEHKLKETFLLEPDLEIEGLGIGGLWFDTEEAAKLRFNIASLANGPVDLWLLWSADGA